MGQAEAKKLMPFIRANSYATARKIARMTDRVEIITESYRKETPESKSWREELEFWRNKVLKANPSQRLIGRESIIELKQIYERLKKSYTTKTE